MNILFIHGNYPAQFRTLAHTFGSQGSHDVRYLTARKDPENYPLPGVKVIKYNEDKLTKLVDKSSAQKVSHEMIARGEIIQEQVIKILQTGFEPKLVFFHGANGIGTFLRGILPNSTLIGYFEWYFSKRCARLILGRSDLDAINLINARNIATKSEILDSDAAIVPTNWQLSQFPANLQKYLTVIFDGVDTNFFRPPINKEDLFNNSVRIQGEKDCILLKKNELLLSYATRGMEPLRGFPEFMKTLPALLNDLPNLKILIGGRDRSAYGPCSPKHEGSWLKSTLEEVPELINHPRIFYTGLMSYDNYLLMLQRTNLHCYFTKPYVTSWSLFEAVATGCPILTNKCEATTGTVDSPMISTINSIDELDSIESVHLIKNLLLSKPERKGHLATHYTKENSNIQWEKYINMALSKIHST